MTVSDKSVVEVLTCYFVNVKVSCRTAEYMCGPSIKSKHEAAVFRQTASQPDCHKSAIQINVRI